jgi:hypothetical protein
MDCVDILTRHTNYLAEGFECKRLAADKWSVVTPYSLPDGDLVELVVEDRGNGRVRVRDYGETVATLHLQGFDPTVSDKRRWLFDQALRAEGVEFDAGELRKDGSESEVGALLLDVAATARAVADLIYLHRSVSPQDFDARVVSFLANHAADVQPKVTIKGESGHPYRITARAFRADGTQLLVSTLSPKGRGSVKAVVDRTVRQWVDINHDVARVQKVSFLNDVSVAWPAADLRLLNRFSVITGWRARHQLTPVLEGRLAEPDLELAIPLWETDLEASSDQADGE